MMDPIAIAVFGWTEILFVAGLVVLLFGATRLPQIGKGLGEGIREFRRALTGGGGDEEEKRRIDEGRDGGRKGDA